MSIILFDIMALCAELLGAESLCAEYYAYYAQLRFGWVSPDQVYKASYIIY